MSRDITAAVDTALSSDNVPLLAFVEMDFSSGFVRVTNAGHSFTWNGYTWNGLGELGRIDNIKEGAGIEAYGVKLQISGVNPANISLALNENYQGRSCKIWLAPLSANYAVIADPVLVFSGRMDVMNIEIGQTATITVSAESRLADWDRARIRRFTHEDQIAVHPYDTGFQYVAQMVEKQLVWGRA